MSEAPEVLRFYDDELSKTLKFMTRGGNNKYVRADRIEQLAATNEELEVKLRKSALQELSALGQASDAYQAQLAAEARIEELEAKLKQEIKETERVDRVWSDNYAELEAQLAKAVDALAQLATDEHPQGWIAIATLAALKGKDDE